MPKKEKIDGWRALKEREAPQAFKLGSIFFWTKEEHYPFKDHYYIYLGPLRDERTQSFFVGASSQEYWDTGRNFAIVPEDFRKAGEGTRVRAFSKTTYFIFSQYLTYHFETSRLIESYINGTLEYKFNLKTDLPDAYDRFIKFMNEQLPPAYVEVFLEPSNILPDKKQICK